MVFPPEIGIIVLDILMEVLRTSISGFVYKAKAQADTFSE